MKIEVYEEIKEKAINEAEKIFNDILCTIENQNNVSRPKEIRRFLSSVAVNVSKLEESNFELFMLALEKIRHNITNYEITDLMRDHITLIQKTRKAFLLHNVKDTANTIGILLWSMNQTIYAILDKEIEKGEENVKH